MARKFLYAVIILIVLFTIGAGLLYYFQKELMKLALVPGESFAGGPATPAQRYKNADMWFARPDIPGNPALWTPANFKPGDKRPAAVFFIHPTSYIDRAHWNAPLDDPRANQYARVFLKGQASAFNEIGDVWAPRYRQATFGAFLTSQADAEKALDFAYRDVLAAFDEFLAEVGPDRPIVLAGHSQGALHLERLLRERVAGKPLANRIVAAYVVGWPISKTADLPVLGLPECTAADQAGCILSWQSYAEPADPSQVLDVYDATTGFDGQPRKDTAMVCTNPITGTANGTAEAKDNLGTLVPTKALDTAMLAIPGVPAACTGRGLLSIGTPIDLGGYVLPGNNYHVFDYSLFWANVRRDVMRRYQAKWGATPAPAGK
ncbi:DUF3089 domain-containing protein [Sphingomonas panacisoli]|uniref:DUF3089 domain-containing protein n=1 Tax=Sphingomonas panacisoli TaxID=1813879 RepID=A0A5B8LGH6_9SPHN|nr:DUF3089 domain-containing protein [Sphingomonas panacisoli]QDZ07388.1 DUF3089 domain-containing protein [Sphingomonas panacisoli]